MGGVWVFSAETEDDVTGRESGRCRVHSSMYTNLRTNLPREASSVREPELCLSSLPCRAVRCRAVPCRALNVFTRSDFATQRGMHRITAAAVHTSAYSLGLMVYDLRI